MNKLNPEKQIQLSSEIVRDISDSYGVTVDDWNTVDRGIGNMVVRLVSGDYCYYAKFYSSLHPTARVEEEIEFVNRLQGKAPVPSIVPTIEGDFYQEVQQGDNEHALVLTTEIEGQPLVTYSPSIIQQLSFIHTRMHSVDSFSLHSAPLEVRSDYNFFPEPDAVGIEGLSNKAAEYLETLDGIWEYLPSGIVHLDIVKDNVLANKRGIAGIIDFEDTAYAPYVFCLAGTLWDIAMTDGVHDGEKFRAYLKNYQKYRELSVEETSIINEIVYLRGWIALNGVLLTQDAKFRPREQDLLEKFSHGT